MTLTYRGAPVLVLPYEPDWTGPVTLSVRHDTSVFEALDGSEERWRRFPRPLYGISYPAVVAGRQQGRLRKLFELAEAKPAAVPLWTESVRLSAGAELSATELSLEDAGVSLLRVFRFALLWRDWEDWEIVELDLDAEPSPGVMALAEPTERAWQAGDRLIPLPLGTVRRPDFSQPSAEVSTLRIDFEEIFNPEFGQLARIDAAEFVEEIVEPWDYTTCGVALVDGGGDTFDCYPVGLISDDGIEQQEGFGEITLSGGTNLGEWQHGNSPFGQILGDTFDSYTAEETIAQSLAGGVDISEWQHGNSPIGEICGDTFDSYAAEGTIAQTLAGGANIGEWTHGDA